MPLPFCEKVIVDKASRSKEQRSGLGKARDLLRTGDVLVVWRPGRHLVPEVRASGAACG